VGSAPNERPKLRPKAQDIVVKDILAVALSEFAEHGLAGARVDAIAARTRTSKRMLYYHFGSKEGLYAATLVHAYERVREHQHPPDTERLAPMQALAAYVGHAFDVHVNSPEFVRMVMGENLIGARFVRDAPVVRAANQKGVDELVRIVHRGQQQGLMRSDIKAMDVYANIVGLAFHFVSNRSSFSAIFAQDLSSLDAVRARREVIIDTINRQVASVAGSVLGSEQSTAQEDVQAVTNAVAPMAAVSTIDNQPSLEHVYDAVIDIAERRDLGTSPLGARYIIDILGGSFAGPRLRGEVLPGGADRQLVRADGVKELDALYEMRTDDGAMITVRNRVVIEDPSPQGRYARSTVRLTAPEGPYAWLNRRVFIGTLAALRPAREAVKVSVYLVV
jgi:AcrR family transcriptional regulator